MNNPMILEAVMGVIDNINQYSEDHGEKNMLMYTEEAVEEVLNWKKYCDVFELDEDTLIIPDEKFFLDFLQDIQYNSLNIVFHELVEEGYYSEAVDKNGELIYIVNEKEK